MSKTSFTDWQSSPLNLGSVLEYADDPNTRAEPPTGLPMSQTASRLSRWQSDGDRIKSRGGSALDQQASNLAATADAAMESAMVASRSAGDRLERNRGQRQSRVGQTAACGAVGLAGLIGLMFGPGFNPVAANAAAGFCGLVTLAAGFLLARMAWHGDPGSETIAAAIASDLAVGAQAKRLARLADTLEPSATAREALSRLVEDAERDARAARDRETLARGGAQLTGRRHERIVPRHTRVLVQTPDQRTLNAQIVDVSLSGVAVSGNFPGVEVGQLIRVGARRSRVVRVLPRGLACEFAELLSPEQLTPDIVL